MKRVLVSSCLLGEPVRYDGGAFEPTHPVLARWLREGRVLPCCPEVAGGLPVPRPPAEIAGGADGGEVLAGRARILDPAGRDLTAPFLAGAAATLDLARAGGAVLAVLKEGSPSCGSAAIHDGAFSGVRVPGQGVAAARLRAAGIPVFSERQWEAAAACLEALES
ncbi:DUF523 domain-containing protein [Mesoterricola sediminis]|uniref:DUF523 domain-containing protein n=1 Tax=Mesoterricola sediminis TaxID=2927980 RepID=A0AA48GYN4_9BACT|nr:DUF523 domain-containing protein [Mesoterricola sediminis]BDU76457.1 hypothetical protein METESE_14150 [Mesoterricola sediminis]